MLNGKKLEFEDYQYYQKKYFRFQKYVCGVLNIVSFMFRFREDFVDVVVTLNKVFQIIFILVVVM